jgi:hypothetical protein
VFGPRRPRIAAARRCRAAPQLDPEHALVIILCAGVSFQARQVRKAYHDARAALARGRRLDDNANRRHASTPDIRPEGAPRTAPGPALRRSLRQRQCRSAHNYGAAVRH